jgi:hypothetical protein
MTTKEDEVVEEIQVQYETGILDETMRPVFQYTRTETTCNFDDCGPYLDVLEHISYNK